MPEDYTTTVTGTRKWATPVAEWMTSGSTNTDRTVDISINIKEADDDIESDAGDRFFFQHYVTPEDELIKAMAARLNGVETAYRTAVKWVYVSDETLNDSIDKWLSPREFLSSTLYYPGNPLSGEAVSDCEEQANTLVSLIRAQGIPAEEVRVVLGRAVFNNIDKGHAWVELLIDGQWVALDPIWGPYWDNQAGCLIERQGMPFSYYAAEEYPALETWIYYNDIYYLNPGNGSGNAPDSWY